MTKFNPNDRITNLLSGEEFVIVSFRFNYGSGGYTKEEYDLMNLKTGAKITVSGKLLAYAKSDTLPVGWTPNVRPPKDPMFTAYGEEDDCGNDLAESLKQVTYDDTRIKFHKSLVKPEGCDHEWVTWTGLRGTVTDCTKCRATQ